MKPKNTLTAIISAAAIAVLHPSCTAPSADYSFPAPAGVSSSGASDFSQATPSGSNDAGAGGQLSVLSGEGGVSNASDVNTPAPTDAGNDAEAAPAETSVPPSAPSNSAGDSAKTSEKSNVPELNILFAYNSSKQFVDVNGNPVPQEAVKTQIVDYVSKAGNASVYVDGYASVEGNEKYNLALSLARAKTLASMLCDAKFAGSVNVSGLGELDQGNTLTAQELAGVDRLSLADRISNPKLRDDRRVVVTGKNPSESAASYAGSCQEIAGKLVQYSASVKNVTTPVADADDDAEAAPAQPTQLPEAPDAKPAADDEQPPEYLIEAPSTPDADLSDKDIADTLTQATGTIKFYEKKVPEVVEKLTGLEARCKPGMPDTVRPVRETMTGKDGKVYTMYGLSPCQVGYTDVSVELKASVLNLEAAAAYLREVKEEVSVSWLSADEQKTYVTQIEDLVGRAAKLVTSANAAKSNVDGGAKKKVTTPAPTLNDEGGKTPSFEGRRDIYAAMHQAQVQMLYDQGFNTAEIGKTLNMSPAAVESYAALQPKAA